MRYGFYVLHHVAFFSRNLVFRVLLRFGSVLLPLVSAGVSFSFLPFSFGRSFLCYRATLNIWSESQPLTLSLSVSCCASWHSRLPMGHSHLPFSSSSGRVFCFTCSRIEDADLSCLLFFSMHAPMAPPNLEECQGLHHAPLGVPSRQAHHGACGGRSAR